MKAELQEVMNMLRKLQGAIDFGNAPMAEREELAGDVTEIMDALFEVNEEAALTSSAQGCEPQPFSKTKPLGAELSREGADMTMTR
jgi:hypothetical protein